MRHKKKRTRNRRNVKLRRQGKTRGWLVLVILVAVVAAGIAVEKLTDTGVGPLSPLYDNRFPEGRSLNRTVTVFLEYEGKE